MPIAARSCGVQPTGLVRGAGGWDPPAHHVLRPPEAARVPGAEPAESKRQRESRPPRGTGPPGPPGSASPIAEAGLPLHPGGLRPSPARGHSSVQRPPHGDV